MEIMDSLGATHLAQTRVIFNGALYLAIYYKCFQPLHPSRISHFTHFYIHSTHNRFAPAFPNSSLSLALRDYNIPQLQTLHGLFALTAHCESSSSWQLLSIQPAFTISAFSTTPLKARQKAKRHGEPPCRNQQLFRGESRPPLSQAATGLTSGHELYSGCTTLRQCTAGRDW